MNEATKKAALWVLVVATMTGVLAQRFLLISAEHGYFFDELVNILASAQFFMNGIFGHAVGTEFGFEKNPSSGLAALWPAGLGWLIGERLIWARAAFFAYCFGLFFWMARLWLADRRLPFEKNAWLIPVIFLLGVTTIPYAKPMVALPHGEIPGALWLGIGALLLRRGDPLLGGFALAASVWYAKLIYLPFALLFLAQAAWALMTRKSLGRAIAMFVAFVAPLLLWLGWIAGVSGVEGLRTYFANQETFSLGLFKLYLNSTPEVASPATSMSLAERLSSRQLEWAGYSPMDKLRILFLLFFPVGIWVRQALRRPSAEERGTTPRSAHWLVPAGLAVGAIAFGYWYFFLHTGMWVRHLQPALIVGWAALVAIALEWLLAAQRSAAVRRALLLGCVLFLAREAARVTAWSDPATRPSASFAWSCRQPEGQALTVQAMAQWCAPDPISFTQVILRERPAYLDY